MTTEALKEHISQLREWVTGPRQGMGSGLHAEKWPPLTPGARAMLAEHVMWLEQALAELEAAQQQARSHLANVVTCYLYEAAQGDGVNDGHYDAIMSAKVFLGHAVHEPCLLAASREAT